MLKLGAHVKNMRHHRTKAIAHADLLHSVGSKELPDIRYSDLEDAMQELENIMLKLGTRDAYRAGSYNQPIIAFGTDGNTLLVRLGRAKNIETEA